MLKQPVITFPKDFDKYDAKVTDKTRLTANGVEGNMIYDFLAVPRNQGNYTIPAVEFTYYDTSANKYKTIKTQPFTLNVEKGDGTSDNETSDFSNKDKDIHALKLGKSKLHDRLLDQSAGSIGSLLCPAHSLPSPCSRECRPCKGPFKQGKQDSNQAPEEGSSADARWQAGRILR